MPDDRRPRLNLFALPSQTTVLFAGILFVAGAPLLLRFDLRFVLLLPLLPLAVPAFALWDFLVEPARVRARFAAAPVPPALDALHARWERLSGKAGLSHPPRLLQTAHALRTPFAFGTFRLRYVLLPAWLAEEFDRALADDLYVQGEGDATAVEAILRHELAHFANGDVRLTFFARSFLKATVLTLLAYWAALVWQPVIYALIAPRAAELAAATPQLVALLPEPARAVLLDPPTQTAGDILVSLFSLTLAALPLVAGALVLWQRDWNLLLQVRELYADARVVQWMGDWRPIEAGLKWLKGRRAPHIAGAARRLAPWGPGAAPALGWPDAQAARGWWRAAPAPSWEQRRAVLERPEAAYGDPAAQGSRAGVLSLLLFVMMSSLLAPAQAGIGAEATLGVAFAALALGLTPTALVQLPDRRAARSAVRRAVLGWLRVFAWVPPVLALVALFAVLVRPDFLDLTIYSVAGVTPGRFGPAVENPVAYVAQAFAGTAFVYLLAGPLLLALFLRADLALKQRLMNWTGAAWPARRPAAAFLGITAALLALLWFGALPLLNWLAFPGILTPGWGRGAGVLLALAGAAAGWWAVRRGEARYAGVCPACGARTAEPPFLGAHCPQCGAVVAPWLTASDQ